MNSRIVLICCCAASFFLLEAKSAPNSFGNVDYITGDQLHDYLSFIASDELEGRDTPSRGLNIAAKFIATQLSRWGFERAGDSGSYFQQIALLRTKVLPRESYVEINGKRFAFGNDFISGAAAANGSAPLVFVQHGYIFDDKKINPYSGISIKGKIVVTLGGLPNGIRYGDLRGREKGKDYETPATYAQKNGAVGIIVIPSDIALRSWEKNRKTAVDDGNVKVIEFMKNETPEIPSITVSKETARMLFDGEKYSSLPFDDKDSLEKIPPFEFGRKKNVSFAVAAISDTLFTQNICAVLRGSDKVLKNEFVAFGAHYDHIGIGNPVNGDSINNGADDDGSGTCGLLAMAEAFSKGPRPKRSLLFVWHVGEEKGLWGSQYFTEHPTVPLEQIVTQLNIDMIGRSKPDTGKGSDNEILSGTNETFIIGSKMLSTQLGKISEDVNSKLLKMKFNYHFDDPNDPLKLYYRSDHYNYAKKGIPIIFYFDGLHEDYHKVSDEVEKIDFGKYLKVTRTVFATGWTLANLPKRPLIDHHAAASFEGR